MMEMDRLNLNILQELRINGRISNTELADKVGLSPSACLRRVQELERSGVIEGYYAKLNTKLLGRSFIAYVTVGLSDHSKSSLEAFEKAIVQADEITECHNTTGSFEYILRIEVTDLAHYKLFHSNTLGVLPQVSSITTYVVIDSPKELHS